ncbi:hypothetical protein [Selenomonas ruminantium]|uniref:Single-stranded DNA-binding protein n=1 Tax=Selenomonas ruminantium TaxID=971 RepID=A0A1I0YB79_SELRU|nr:hypothetical protein [Selenomonas ruminantium]SFB10599.1 hypothetical protein SAMN05216587_11181 [Selenomonas ruminantium]
MNLNVNLTEKPVVSFSGKAHWVKVNTRFDEFEGKRKYKLALSFDKETETKMKKICDDYLAAAKENEKFQGKKWSADATCGYKEQENGELYFFFQTGAFYRDKQTGEEKQRFVPVVDTVRRIQLDKDVAIGDGSMVRVLYQPSAYYASARANGINLYIVKLAVDKLIEYRGGAADFSEFGIELAENKPADDFGIADEEVPI